MKINSICRVCLKDGKLLFSLFEMRNIQGDKSIKSSDMFRICTSLVIEESDGHPKHICSQCYKKLRSAYKFHNLCKKSFDFINDYLKNTTSGCRVELETPNYEPSESYNPTKVEEIKCETSDHDYEDSSILQDLSDEHINSLYNVVCVKDLEENDIKKEIENEINDNKKVEFQVINDDCRIKLKEKKKPKIKKFQFKRKRREILKCSFCDKIFKFKSTLVTHEDTHIGLKRYFCELCNKAYRSERDHKNMHKRGFKFICDMCNKCFGTKAKLSLHMNTHNTNRRMIVCGLDGCDKQFITEGGLQRHRNHHDGVRNFICHLCSKTFKDKYTLELHIKIHNNDKKFQCSYCDKKFVQSSAKIQHEKRHINKKDHPCPQCDQHFYNRGVLKRHLLTHTKILSEACRFCLKRFSRRDNRRRHEMVMHNVAKSEFKNENND